MKEDYSDYEVFRQEYKSWHGQWTRCQQDPAKRQAERERKAARHAERSARPPEPAQPCFKKPRGRAPLAEGKPCSWNSDDGFWTTANGCYHDVGAAVRKASKTEHFQRSKRIDVEEQNQRRSLCARIAAAVEASRVPAPSASRRHRLWLSERCDKIVLTPAPLFWAKAEALVAQEEFLTTKLQGKKRTTTTPRRPTTDGRTPQATRKARRTQPRRVGEPTAHVQHTRIPHRTTPRAHRRRTQSRTPHRHRRPHTNRQPRVHPTPLVPKPSLGPRRLTTLCPPSLAHRRWLGELG